MKYINIFLGKLEDCCSSNLSFWEILLTDNPDTNRLNRIGNKIFKVMKEIHDL